MDKIDKFSPLDITLFIVFIVYIILPIGTPDFLAGYVNSPLGMLFMFVVTVFLFLYTNPILAVLYIFVAYELIRRSNHTLLSSYDGSHTPNPSDMNNTNSIYANTIIPTQNSTQNPTYHPTQNSTQNPTYYPTQNSTQNPTNKMEGFRQNTTTLEEYIVNKMSPMGHSNSDTYLSSSYQPVCDPVGHASMFCSSRVK
jgi:uncharacterized membrane protein (DUF485 family)